MKSKPFNAQPSRRGFENQDPNETNNHTNGVSKMKNVSRLPVLAKSLQTVPADICQRRWEEKPLLGKAQKRKTCTKPIPFSLSKAWNCNQMSTDGVSVKVSSSGKTLSCRPQQAPPQNRTQPGATTQECASLNMHKRHPDNTGTKAVPSSLEHHETAASKLNKALSETWLADDASSNAVVSSIQSDLSAQLGSITLANSEHANAPCSVGNIGSEDKADCQVKTKSSVQTALSASATQTTGVCGIVQAGGADTTVFLPQRVFVKKKVVCSGTEAMSENTVAFSPDPAALCSILLNEGVRVGSTPRGSACFTGRATSIYSAQRVPVRKPQTHVVGEPAGSAVSSSPVPLALCNILLNEGVKVGSSVGASPRVSMLPSGRGTSVYSAQRVPVKKARTETAAARPGSNGGAIAFSPDPAALRSILLNEGVKVRGLVGATPRESTCPSARGTSIYSAQRVPVKKTGADVTAPLGASRTPAWTQTQQRVPCSQLQSVRRLVSAHKTSFFSGSPGFSGTQAPSTDSSAQPEEHVVQRLFQEEPEQEEKLEEAGKDAISGQVQEQHHATKPGLKQKGDMDTDRHRPEKERELRAGQPFIQEAHRQSVIVFSSGRGPLDPDLGHPGVPTAAHPTPQHAGQKEPSIGQTSRSQSALNPDANKGMTLGVLCKTKASGSSLAVCALKRRLPPLEEMFLDDECATYTSSQQSWPTQPRCTNPVASLLLFHDSTCFVPIDVMSPNLSPVPCVSLPIRA